MERYTIAESALIPAPPERVYAILADYEVGHPSILPRPPFTSVRVERGGYGAGTEFVIGMRVMGREQFFHGTISEPEPGRVLVETVRENGAMTSFTVEPEGSQSRVTIAVNLPLRPGLGGRIERWMSGRMFHPVLRRELAQLAELAAAGAPSGYPSSTDG
jgi:uncharacterized protein YndB with AHSA1/START domain